MEAETMGSDLCIRNQVDAVLSEDTDILAYGSPVFLTKFDSRTGLCVRIEYKKLLESFNFTPEQFLDFCIMCGTDYNNNIPRIGPSKAYKLILEHKNIETVGSECKLDTTILNHKRTRELFREYEISDKLKVPYCGFPDFKQLQIFFKIKNVNLNAEDLKKYFVQNENIIIEEDELEN